MRRLVRQSGRATRPRGEITKPATMAVQMLAAGEQPEAMAKATASGSARTPTVIPEAKAFTKLSAVIGRQAR